MDAHASGYDVEFAPNVASRLGRSLALPVASLTAGTPERRKEKWPRG